MRHLASRFISSMAQSPRQSEAGQPPASGLPDAADTEFVALRVRHYLPPTPFAPGHRSADPSGPELGEPRDSFLRFCGQKVEMQAVLDCLRFRDSLQVDDRQARVRWHQIQICSSSVQVSDFVSECVRPERGEYL